MTTFSLLQNGHILYWYTVMSSPSKCGPLNAVGAAAAAVDEAAAAQEGTAPAAICRCTATVETQSPAPPTAGRQGQQRAIVKQQDSLATARNPGHAVAASP